MKMKKLIRILLELFLYVSVILCVLCFMFGFTMPFFITLGVSITFAIIRHELYTGGE